MFDLSLGSFFALIFVAVFAAGVGAILTLLIGKWMILRVERVNYEKLSKTMLVFLAVMVTILTGFVGLAIFVVGSAIGLLAPLSGSRRIHAMGCLIIPVLVWYL